MDDDIKYLNELGAERDEDTFYLKNLVIQKLTGAWMIRMYENFTGSNMVVMGNLRIGLGYGLKKLKLNCIGYVQDFIANIEKLPKIGE